MKKGTARYSIFVFVMVIAGLAYYFYLSNRPQKSPDLKTHTDAQIMLEKNLDEDYPKTVRETVKYHCNYLKYSYNDKYSDDELVLVNRQIRKLLDEELLEINDEDTQLQGLKKEIQQFKDEKKKFVNFSLAEGSQVQYNTEGDIEYASIKVTLGIQVSGSAATVEEEYLLRKDSTGRWKIMGWQVSN